VQSTLGVAAVSPVAPALLAQTLTHLSADIPPLGIKIGMLATAELVSIVANFLLSLPTPTPLVVLDPVLISSSGRPLLTPEGIAALTTELLPLVDYITPNLVELEALNRAPSASTESALRTLSARHPNLHIVATGGESSPTHSTDILLTPSGALHTFTSPRLDTTSTHGTGCAFSSALLSHLLLGLDAPTAVAAAKHFTTEAIRLAPAIGHGRGPLNLLWPLTHREESTAPELLP
jgi:hydroxymethylpyrimidine/phosphomethylpyrimidine kinase